MYFPGRDALVVEELLRARAWKSVRIFFGGGGR
jgi:hypothetical protein